MGLLVSTHPPWSIATSTITEPLFILFNIFFVTSFGASAPGIKTPPTSKSHSEINLFKSVFSLKVGMILSPKILPNSSSLF